MTLHRWRLHLAAYLAINPQADPLRVTAREVCR
jgi:hypothetical protein